MAKTFLSLLFFLLIDCLIVIYKLNFDYLNFRSQFWIFHLTNCLVFNFVNKKKLKIRMEFYDLLIIFLPVVGFLLLIFQKFSIFKGKFHLDLKESPDLALIAKRKKDLEYIELNNELNTPNIYEVLNTKNPKLKKDFIMKFDFPDEKVKVDFYKTALKDDDIDVIHFAAVELNRLDEKFQTNLRNVEKRQRAYDLLDHLIKYCESGLLRDFLLKSYQKKTISLLENLENKNDKYLVELLKLYDKTGEKGKCKKILESKIFSKECGEDILKFAAKFYYNENNFEMVEFIEKKLNKEE